MSTFRIKQGRHYHVTPPFSILPWIGQRYMSRVVTFSAECQYDSAAYNADDVNKLFGLSFGFGGVHRNSARFGWRWSQRLQAIELLAYCYSAGERNRDEQFRYPVVAVVQLNEPVHCLVSIPSSGYYQFRVHNQEGEEITQLGLIPAGYNYPGYGLTHGLYWGGQTVAPHEMTVKINRV